MAQSLEQLFEMTQRHVQRVMGEAYAVEQVMLDSAFLDAGIDSLYLTEIAFALLTEVDLYVPMAQVARTQTVREFLELVRTELEAR